LGRAGESFVAGHLLRGLNPAPLGVDVGVDLLAYGEFKTAGLLLLHAEHEIYQFQDNCDERIPIILANQESP
jgi:hypothetical protein